MNPLQGLQNSYLISQYYNNLFNQIPINGLALSPYLNNILGDPLNGNLGYFMPSGSLTYPNFNNYLYSPQLNNALLNMYGLGNGYIPFAPAGYNPLFGSGFNPGTMFNALPYIGNLTQVPGRFAGLGLPVPPGYNNFGGGGGGFAGGGMPHIGGAVPFRGGGIGYAGGFAPHAGRNIGGIGGRIGGGFGFGNVKANPGVSVPGYGPNPTKAQINDMIEAAAHKYGVPADIAKAVAYHESGWNPHARGDHGKSYGMMQIYTKAHPDYNVKRGIRDPRYNIEYGVKMLADLHKKYGSWWKAVERYNGKGPHARQYVKDVFATLKQRLWEKFRGVGKKKSKHSNLNSHSRKSSKGKAKSHSSYSSHSAHSGHTSHGAAHGASHGAHGASGSHGGGHGGHGGGHGGSSGGGGKK